MGGYRCKGVFSFYNQGYGKEKAAECHSYPCIGVGWRIWMALNPPPAPWVAGSGERYMDEIEAATCALRGTQGERYMDETDAATSVTGGPEGG